MKPEATLRQQVAEYLQLQYPDIIYRFDLAADLKLTAGQAVRHKHLHPHRGYPDLFIAQPAILAGHRFAGLYIELKAEGKNPYRKDGKLKKDKHLEEQAYMLHKLLQAGYFAVFCVGFEDCKQTIDGYLRGYKKQSKKLEYF